MLSKQLPGGVLFRVVFFWDIPEGACSAAAVGSCVVQTYQREHLWGRTGSPLPLWIIASCERWEDAALWKAAAGGFILLLCVILPSVRVSHCVLMIIFTTIAIPNILGHIHILTHWVLCMEKHKTRNFLLLLCHPALEFTLVLWRINMMLLKMSFCITLFYPSSMAVTMFSL